MFSRVWLFATPWTAAHQASLSITNSWSLLKLMSTESVMPSNHLILCHPLLLPSSIFPSIRVFSSESVLRIRWPKYQSFSFSINPASEYSGVISFRVDWMDLLAVQGTLKSLLQHHRVYLPVSLGNHPVYLCLMTLVSSFQLNNLQGERIIILYFKASLPMWAGPGVIKWLPKSQTKFLENILILSKSTIKPHSDSVISMNYDCECCSNIATIRYF